MTTRYAYSFDRNTFHGSFASRQEAYYAALTRGSELTDRPEAIYVAERIQPSMQSGGHASQILREMRRRAELEVGDAAVDWLKDVPGGKQADLDKMIGEAVQAWLRKHEYLPTFFTVRGVSETAPVAEPAKTQATTQDELNAVSCSC
jgi:hypothetical protein